MTESSLGSAYKLTAMVTIVSLHCDKPNGEVERSKGKSYIGRS